MGKGAGKMKMEVLVNGRAVPKDQALAVLLATSERMRARSLQRRLERTVKRHENAPERQSVAIAMLAVEEHIVKALWTIARQPLGKIAPLAASRCGIEYFHDRMDIHSIYADAAGGKWDSIAPRPAVPSARDITQANRVQDWLLLIDDERLRRLLVVGATSKRGDAGRRINWERLRPSLAEYGGVTVRTIQRSYDEAIRIIVNELTFARVA